MYRYALAYLVAGSALCGPAGAATPLAPLDFLVDACWRGAFPDGKAADTHCFAKVLGGHFIRDQHTVTGGPGVYSGESMYAWDPEAGRIRYQYWGSDGGHSEGSLTPEAARLVFADERHVGTDGTVTVMRSVWQRDGDDAYVAITERKDGNAWKEMWRMRMTRVAQAPDGGPVARQQRDGQ